MNGKALAIRRRRVQRRDAHQRARALAGCRARRPAADHARLCHLRHRLRATRRPLLPGLAEPGASRLNDEMLENFAYASYKKVRDVAVDLLCVSVYGQASAPALLLRRLRRRPEGLTMAQRFPAIYHGIVSVVPSDQLDRGLFHVLRAQRKVPQFGDWLDVPRKHQPSDREVATADACDALDGLRRWRRQQLPGVPAAREPAAAALPRRHRSRGRIACRTP